MLSDIENLDIMLGENHFNSREREGSLIVICPGDLGALQATSPKMRMGTWVKPREILTLGQIPSVIAIQLLATLALK